MKNPQASGRRFSASLRDFVGEAVNLYECGLDEGHAAAILSQQLKDVDPGCSYSKDLLAVQDFSEDDFMCSLSVVWCTLAVLPRGVVPRWAHRQAVSPTTLSMWRTFVGMIVTAYFEKRMKWYPLDRLQLELSVTQGRNVSPEVVEDLARLVFATLECIDPHYMSTD